MGKLVFGANKKEKDPILTVLSLLPGATDNEEVMPQKASNFYPSWWKSMPRFFNNGDNSAFTAKACPSFVDYFGQGFVVPAWSDAELTYNSEDGSYIIKEPSPAQEYGWSYHRNAQFLDHVNAKYMGKEPEFTFKANPPLRFITKPGWSLLQLPMFYDFDSDLTALPGIIDTDIHHEVNIQMFYFGKGKTIKVKKGEPLAHLIPFKRNKNIDMQIRDIEDKDMKKIKKNEFFLDSSFVGSGSYKKEQKKRDRDQ